MPAPTMEKVVNLCKRRGSVYRGSETYGGLGSSLDYGPLGVELKRNVKEAWWREIVTGRDDVVGLDAAIIMHPRVWEASGHLAGFTDPLVDCKACKQRFRADHVQGTVCPECGGELTAARQFNLMFKTYVGPVEDTAHVAFLRPETAQGTFINFRNVLETSRLKLPFGIAQIGRSFRNEITPGNFLFRTREFEQMELEFFVRPGEDERWYDYWRNARLAPYKAAVFPLLRKDGQPERARRIYDALRRHFPVDYDQAGSIGRRYRRQDEVGTPFGITVDHDTMKDGTVTLRDRDAMTQVRLPEDRLVEELGARIARS